AGAATAAVMSYTAWQRDFGGDPAVVGGAFYVNTKPVTVVGVAPKGFYGDRISTTPPDFYLPIESMTTLANAPYVRKPEVSWLYIIGRMKPGVATAAVEGKVSATLRHVLAQVDSFKSQEDQKLIERAHIVLTP